jgi:hypothetical protein
LINLDCKAKIFNPRGKKQSICLVCLPRQPEFKLPVSNYLFNFAKKKNSFQLSGVKRNENEKQFESAFDINGTKRFVELRKETKQNKDRKMRT